MTKFVQFQEAINVTDPRQVGFSWCFPFTISKDDGEPVSHSIIATTGIGVVSVKHILFAKTKEHIIRCIKDSINPDKNNLFVSIDFPYDHNSTVAEYLKPFSVEERTKIGF